MPPADLHADDVAGELGEVAHRFEHHEGDRRRGRRRDLAGGRLDEVGAAGHGQPRRPAHVVQRGQLAGLEDHLEVGPAAGRLHRTDLVEHRGVAPGEEGAPVDHHVDLVGARVDRVGDVGQLHVEGGPAGRERGGHRRDGHPRAGHGTAGGAHEVGVDADGRDARAGVVAGLGLHRLGAQRPHLAGRVGALERGEVGHRHDGVERPALGTLLDRPGGQARDPGLGAHLVDPRQAVQEAAQGRVRRGRRDQVVRACRVAPRRARRRTRSPGHRGTMRTMQTTVVDHPLAQQLLTRLRDERTDRATFRQTTDTPVADPRLRGDAFGSHRAGRPDHPARPHPGRPDRASRRWWSRCCGPASACSARSCT